MLRIIGIKYISNRKKERTLQQKQAKPSPKEDVEEVADVPEVKKSDLSKIDELLDQIDEILEEETVAEKIAKLEFKEKLKSIQFPSRRRSELPITLQVTNIITCEFRCENCTCGR